MRFRRARQHVPHDVVATLIYLRAGFQFGLYLFSLPLFQRGGLIPGGWHGARSKTYIAARRGASKSNWRNMRQLVRN